MSAKHFCLATAHFVSLCIFDRVWRAGRSPKDSRYSIFLPPLSCTHPSPPWPHSHSDPTSPLQVVQPWCLRWSCSKSSERTRTRDKSTALGIPTGISSQCLGVTVDTSLSLGFLTLWCQGGLVAQRSQCSQMWLCSPAAGLKFSCLLNICGTLDELLYISEPVSSEAK